MEQTHLPFSCPRSNRIKLNSTLLEAKIVDKYMNIVLFKHWTVNYFDFIMN